ncbi:transcription antitermination factor NusB [Nitrosophilus kaiyonis]|uniref:transcription antitermination factor NusB n=1 Tax=Nitrosophilus kaiyonis TaxID=2930200 RepID=UPI0024935DF6|nr:transcription antitermination factor NusB [Nitrosophilus kaiyonis]
MATRHQAREAVVGLLYAYDLGNPEIKKFAESILEEKKIRNKQREFALNLFKGTVENLEKIDEEIKKHLESWDIERVGHIEKAILRLGVYELLFTDLDKAIAINEAIELAKKLGTDQSPKFINGVLDAIAKER